MAEEKRIRVSISGDASSLSKEFKRIQSDAKQAFSDIGLDKVLDKADKDFAKIADRIKAVNQILKDHKRDTDSEFTERSKHATNAFSNKRINEDKRDSDQVQEEAWQKWQRLADYFKEALKSRKIDSEGNPIGPPEDPDDPNPKKKLTLGQRVLLRSIQGGRFNPGGGVQEGVAGEGGLAEAAGLGTAGVLIASAISAALVAVIAKAGQIALKDLRVENRLEAKFRGGAALGQSSFDGLSPTDLKEYILDQARSRTSSKNIEQISKQRLDLKYGYGLDDGSTQRFDQFRQQGSAEGSRLIADILSRSEKGGILGISKTDFTLLPQKIEQVANLMSIQKANGEKVDSNTALNLISAGTKIGGRFGDDRASEAFGRIDSSIKNPGSAGMKAFIFEELRKANPHASYTDLLAMQENGASKDNLRAILPDIARVPKGEYRRMMLHQLTGNWQDAKRLDQAGSLEEMLSSLNNKPLSNADVAKRFGGQHEQAKALIDGFSSIGAKFSEALTDFGHTYMDPLSDLLAGRTKWDFDPHFATVPNKSGINPVWGMFPGLTGNSIKKKK